jgi:hypothetical protein
VNELNRHFSKEVQMPNKYEEKCSKSLVIKEFKSNNIKAGHSASRL